MLAQTMFKHLLVTGLEDVQGEQRVWKKKRAWQWHHRNVIW